MTQRIWYAEPAHGHLCTRRFAPVLLSIRSYIRLLPLLFWWRVCNDGSYFYLPNSRLRRVGQNEYLFNEMERYDFVHASAIRTVDRPTHCNFYSDRPFIEGGCRFVSNKNASRSKTAFPSNGNPHRYP